MGLTGTAELPRHPRLRGSDATSGAAAGHAAVIHAPRAQRDHMPDQVAACKPWRACGESVVSTSRYDSSSKMPARWSRRIDPMSRSIAESSLSMSVTNPATCSTCVPGLDATEIE